MKEKIKTFVTDKCNNCNNVIRTEYNQSGKHKPCIVCGGTDWVKVVMKEINQ